MAEDIYLDGDVNRLVAGNSDNGGLRDVNNDRPDGHDVDFGFRLLGGDQSWVFEGRVLIPLIL